MVALTVAHARNQTGVVITTEAELAVEGVTNDGYGTLAPGDAPADGDRDGMPDAWEERPLARPREPRGRRLTSRRCPRR
jgi:hypothetical protein